MRSSPVRVAIAAEHSRARGRSEREALNGEKPDIEKSISGFSGKKSRRRPTLPHGYPCSTIGSEELNFRVRDGIGCGLFEIITGNCGCREPRNAQVRAVRA